MKRNRLWILSIALFLTSCGGGGGGGPAPVQPEAAHIYVINNLPAPNVVTALGWWPFADHRDPEMFNWTDLSGDPIVAGETRFWIDLPYEDFGYNVAVEVNGALGKEYIGFVLTGNVLVPAD